MSNPTGYPHTARVVRLRFDEATASVVQHFNNCPASLDATGTLHVLAWLAEGGAAEAVFPLPIGHESLYNASRGSVPMWVLLDESSESLRKAWAKIEERNAKKATEHPPSVGWGRTRKIERLTYEEWLARAREESHQPSPDWIAARTQDFTRSLLIEASQTAHDRVASCRDEIVEAAERWASRVEGSILATSTALTGAVLRYHEAQRDVCDLDAAQRPEGDPRRGLQIAAEYLRQQREHEAKMKAVGGTS